MQSLIENCVLKCAYIITQMLNHLYEIARQIVETFWFSRVAL